VRYGYNDTCEQDQKNNTVYLYTSTITLNLKAQLAHNICASSQQQSTNTDLNSIPSSSRVPELAVLIAVRISLSGTTD
jgi:hypothetical protein